MIEAPDRIFVAWPYLYGSGLAFNSAASNRTEYTRADLLTAALARAEAAEADARSWKTVALSNQAMAQSHCERWARAEASLATAREDALREAAAWCAGEADKCEDAAKWGGARKYVSDCKAAAYALRNADFRILALIKPPAKDGKE